MRFSVLIAAYRAAGHLPGALESVAGQAHADWELVVVEDGSRDGTEELVREFAAAHPGRRVVYDNLGENRGVAAARNRLLELAEGEALAFLDADDVWRPGHLAGLAEALAGGCAVAFTGVEWWDGAANRSMGEFRPRAARVERGRVGLFEMSFIQTSSCVALTRATVERTGRFDEALRIGEDRDYWFRALAGGGRLGMVAEATCRYTKHAGSSMARTGRVAADAVAFYRKHAGAEDIPAKLRRESLAEALWVHGRLARAEDRVLARRCFWEAVRLRPWRPRYWLHALL